MKNLILIIILSFSVSSCKESSSPKVHTAKGVKLFNEKSFDSSIAKRTKEAGWSFIAGGKSYTIGGADSRVSKYSKNEEDLYVYYEIDTGKSEGYNLRFSAMFFDKGETKKLIDMIEADLPWLKQKALFIDELEVMRTAIPNQKVRIK